VRALGRCPPPYLLNPQPPTLHPPQARRDLLRVLGEDVRAARAAHLRGEDVPGQLGTMVAARDLDGNL
jgi:hypothetical protein